MSCVHEWWYTETKESCFDLFFFKWGYEFYYKRRCRLCRVSQEEYGSGKLPSYAVIK